MSELPAGDFSAWLRAMRESLAGGAGMDVACGECRGCCTSSYYIKVRAHEHDAAAAIRGRGATLAPAPDGNGAQLMGYDAHGHCLMFAAGNCTIYPRRPETCRTYDCRIFTATGQGAGEARTEINERIARWRFAYPTEQDRREQRAVLAAASFLRQHPVRFPGGRVPSRPGDIAVLAVKGYTAFLTADDSDEARREALVAACAEFDRNARPPG